MTDLEKSHRAARVFLARLLMVHGEDAPDVMRRMADELEWLEADARREAQEQVEHELHCARFRKNS